jgi:hypothetical protein
MFKKFLLLAAIVPASAMANTTTYLPLKQAPELEQLIEKLLVVSKNQHVLAKPYRITDINNALQSIKHSYPNLYYKIHTRLQPYNQGDAVAMAKLSLAAGNEEKVMPNSRGITAKNNVTLEAFSYAKISPSFGVTAAGIITEDEFIPTQAFVFMGNEYAQLDVGYREHWYSPLSDSHRLQSTQAEVKPSLTISTVTPFTDFNIRYEMFLSQMSEDPCIYLGKTCSSGKPYLYGFHASAAITNKLTIGANRIMQFGGGERSVSFKDFVEAFFTPGSKDNLTNDDKEELGDNYEFGDQIASVTFQYNSLAFGTSYSFYGDFAFEDTFGGGDRNNAYNFGLYIPLLTDDLALRLETSRWQNSWYSNHLYSQGNRINGNVFGHWFGDERVFDDYSSGESQSLMVNWQLDGATTLDATLRRLESQHERTNQDYGIGSELELKYSKYTGGITYGAELYLGKTVLGESFYRLGVFYGF